MESTESCKWSVMLVVKKTCSVHATTTADIVSFFGRRSS
jgi:hypothetical protein